MASEHQSVLHIAVGERNWFLAGPCLLHPIHCHSHGCVGLKKDIHLYFLVAGTVPLYRVCPPRSSPQPVPNLIGWWPPMLQQTRGYWEEGSGCSPGS